MEHNLYKNLGEVNICTEFERTQSQSTYYFLGTASSRYLGMDVSLVRVAQASTRLPQLIYNYRPHLQIH